MVDFLSFAFASRRFGARSLRLRFASFRCGLVLGLSGILVACGDVAPSDLVEGPQCHGCNVVLITYDALRADHLESYGYEKAVSPALRELALRSTVFERSLSQTGTTLYSIPSILTGRYPHLDRLMGAKGLRAEEQTLAEILAAAGYANAATIAWFYAGCHFGFCEGFEDVDGNFGWADPASKAGDSALRQLAALGSREPFFLWFHMRRPHAPYDPSPALFETFYQPRVEGPSFASPEVQALATSDSRETLRRQVAYLTRHYQALGERAELRALSHLNSAELLVTPSVERQIVALYDASIREADDQLARLLHAIDAAGLAPRTLIVVSADHGEGMGEHGLFDHNDLWYGILHTPLIIHVPGARANVVKAQVMNVDILPTVLGLVGLPAGPGLRGRNLFPASKNSPGRAQYAEYDWGYTLIDENDKLMVRGKQPPGLYDIAADPRETNDLAAARPERVAQLLEQARVLRQGAEDLIPPNESPMRDRLKALGYIE